MPKFSMRVLILVTTATAAYLAMAVSAHHKRVPEMIAMAVVYVGLVFYGVHRHWHPK